VSSALNRHESRGAHFREDFPKRLDTFLARQFVKIGYCPLASAATQSGSQLDHRELRAEARKEIGGVDDASVLAAAANRGKRHFGAQQFTERALGAWLAPGALPGAHVLRAVHGPVQRFPGCSMLFQ
jgi:hypothetical protein